MKIVILKLSNYILSRKSKNYNFTKISNIDANNHIDKCGFDKQIIDFALNVNSTIGKTKTKSQRQLQIGENLKRNLAIIFIEEGLNSFANCYITITEADVSPDAKNAKIFVDVFLKQELMLDAQEDHSQFLKKQISSIISQLNLNINKIRHLLAKKITIRQMPLIKFYQDPRQEQLTRISNLLNNNQQ